MSGWGAALQTELEPDDVVLNFAKGGATTESFVNEGLWQSLLDDLSDGDFVLIQFGHNDQKQPELLAADGGFSDRIDRFIEEVQERNATAILCTSVERRHFANGRLRPSHGPYPAALRRIAAERDLGLVDLTVFTTWLYEFLGDEKAGELFAAGDRTHFNVRGAQLVARFVAQSLRAMRGLDDLEKPMGANQ